MATKKRQETPDQAALEVQIAALVQQRIQAHGDEKTALVAQLAALQAQLAALGS